MKATNAEKSWKIALPLSSLHQWTYNCQTQIYLQSPLKQQYSAATRSFAAAPAHWNRLPAAIRNVASLNIVLRNQSGPFFLTNHFKFYFLLFLHSILYLILYEIFVKRVWS